MWPRQHIVMNICAMVLKHYTTMELVILVCHIWTIFTIYCKASKIQDRKDPDLPRQQENAAWFWIHGQENSDAL